MSVLLKPQDLLVVLKRSIPGVEKHSYLGLARSLGMSTSEVHAATLRATAAGLLRSRDRRVNNRQLLEFVVHGARYVFVPERGGLTRGVPTAHAAPPLDALIDSGIDPPPVWPDPHGRVRGERFEPLYPSAVRAAGADPVLYELLALVDAIRGGRARERKLAEKLLTERLA